MCARGVGRNNCWGQGHERATVEDSQPSESEVVYEQIHVTAPRPAHPHPFIISTCPLPFAPAMPVPHLPGNRRIRTLLGLTLGAGLWERGSKTCVLGRGEESRRTSWTRRKHSCHSLPRLKRKRSKRASVVNCGAGKEGLQKVGYSPLLSQKWVLLFSPCFQQDLKKADCRLAPSWRALCEEGQGKLPRGGWNLMGSRQIELWAVHSHAIPDARWESLALPVLMHFLWKVNLWGIVLANA